MERVQIKLVHTHVSVNWDILVASVNQVRLFRANEFQQLAKLYLTNFR